MRPTTNEFFDRVHSTSPFGVWCQNLDTDEGWSNVKYSQIVGRPFDECRRIGWHLVIHPDDLADYVAASNLLVSIGTPMNLTIRFLRQDGEVRWAKIQGEAVIGPDGTPAETTAFVVDVTDEHRSQAELAAVADQLDRRNEELESSLDAFHDLRLRLTADGTYVSVWAGDPTALVRPADQLVRTNIAADFPPHITKRFLDAIRTTIATSEVTTVIFSLGDGDNCVHFDARLARVGTNEVMAVVRDVSHVRALEDQLVHAHTMESVGRLAGGVAHDFNNVLHVIRGHASALARHLDDAEATELRVGAIVRAVDRTSSLVDQLMLISRPAPNNPTPLVVDRFLMGMQPALQQLLGESIELKCDLNAPHRAVVIDDSRLENVILNLATNARDALEDKGMVTLRTKPAGSDAVIIEFTDTGLGMDAETAARSFDLFFSTKAPGVGTGLGLANAYISITEASGTIKVDSAPGKGSTFTIELPCTQTSTRTETEATDGASPIGRVGSATILVVDDDPEILELCVEVLRHTGYSVLRALNAAEALAMIDDGAVIDVVLTDVMMPGTTGPELASALRLRRSDLRILFMSGYSVTANGEGFPLDTDQFLRKPFSDADLAEAVQAALT